ncbi:phospholipase A1 member A [Cephus cinctus]|uniref:phospholipase A1 n=1 Tax=Cephus cinctus TaxID=211228 RepID=A0AAJ7BJ53_CEPCN|nr:phospholipase A1 member A [Cephus cinctus]
MNALSVYLVLTYILINLIECHICYNGLFNWDYLLKNKEDVEQLVDKIRLKIYTGRSDCNLNSYDTSIAYPENILHEIDFKKPLVIYLHGFREHPSNESVQTVVGAYLDRGNDNILLVDWSDLALERYITLVIKIKIIGKIIAGALEKLLSYGINVNTLHIIGHSLGAQIAGFIGKYSNVQLPRITGLDPAKPGFYVLNLQHIDKTDAKVVDIVHTDGGVYGAFVPTGSVDFFANGGSRPQPGCPFLTIPFTPEDFCSHWRSWRFYAESVTNPYAFMAVKCTSYTNFISGACKDNDKIYFGYVTPHNASGSYYFNTNAQYPFGQNLV